MALAVPNEVALEEGEGSFIERTPAQERARVEKARSMRSQSDYITSNNISKKAANDNGQGDQEEEQAEEETLAAEQARVDRIRFAQAQVMLGSQEEAQNQIEREEKGKPSKLRYAPAFTVAAFKDILDLFAIGSIPLLGTVVTFICETLIFILLVFAKKNSSIEDVRFIIRRLLVIIVSFVVEGFVFGVNFFPFTIATVIIIYFMDKHLSDEQIATLKRITHTVGRKSL